MSVVTNRHDDFNQHLDRKTECAFCYERLWGYPFLEWSGVCICSSCCHRSKQGLTADLVHTAAIVDLQAAGYPNATLVRKSTHPEKGIEAVAINAEKSLHLHKIVK